MLEDNIRTFASDWSGTGEISESGDGEKMCMGAGEYMENEVLYFGTIDIELLQNVYATIDTIVLKYRTGATESACLGASWVEYTEVFASLNYVQLRVEATP